MKSRRPSKTTFVTLAIVGLLMSGCEDFTRFKQERYECSGNQHGLLEIDIRETKVGDEVAVSFMDGPKIMKLTQSSDTAFTVTKGQLILRIDRATGTVRLTRGSRYLNVSCSKSEFRM